MIKDANFNQSLQLNLQKLSTFSLHISLFTDIWQNTYLKEKERTIGFQIYKHFHF